MGLFKKKNSVLLTVFLGIVFLFFITVRFANLDKHIIFNWDQEQYSTEVKALVQDHKLTLLGPRANNDRGFFLGPYFTYLIAPFYIATNLHPIAIQYFVMIYDLIFFVGAIMIVSKVFSRLHTAFFLAFWASNYLLIQYDSTPWWPLLMPLGVLCVWWCLYKINEKPLLKWYALLGVTLGVFINLHSQFIFMCIFTGLVLLQSFGKKEIFHVKKLAVLVGSFLATFLPLLVFDLRHDFINGKLFVAFFSPGGGLLAGHDSTLWIQVVNNLLKPFIYVDNPYLMAVALIFFFISALFLSNKHKGFYRKFYRAFALVLVITLLTFAGFGNRPTETYYVFLYPFFYIVLVDLFLTFKQTKGLVLVLLAIFAINIGPIQTWMNEVDPLGLYYKDKAVSTLTDNLDLAKNFNISYDTDLGLNNGYDYLVNWYGIKQSGQWARDPLVQIRIPPHPGDLVVGVIGLHIPPEVKKN